MKKEITTSTWLPIFTGYYNSIFDGSDFVIEGESDICESDYEKSFSELIEAEVTIDFYRENFWNYANFSKCFNEASERITNALMELDHNDIILDVVYEKTVSPKYYNFSSDSINCKIKYDAVKLEDYLGLHITAFTQYLKDTYTSCSGFHSSYSNDIEDWLDFENYSDHELGSVLQFVIKNNDDEAELNLYYASNCHEAFYDYEFDYEACIKDYKQQLTKVV